MVAPEERIDGKLMMSKFSQTSEQVTVGLIQSGCGEDLEENLNRAVEQVRSAADQGAQIVCLQELFRSRYFCQVHDPAIFDQAETIPGPSTEALGAAAKAAGVVVIASIFEKRAPGLHHNTAAVINVNGSVLGTYRKMHIPHDPLFYEKYYFSPGDQGFRTFDTPFGRIGVLVCWDQWFPEAARLSALAGAQILFYPTAIGWNPKDKEPNGESEREAWLTIQRSHAIANGIFVASVNRIGLETSAGGELAFYGSSFVCDPFGRYLARASTDQAETLIVRCDLTAIERTRRLWPFLRDRRTDAYGPITNRFTD
jgi:N-carbamoylputrescine amidase